jgi:hypothetical protein
MLHRPFYVILAVALLMVPGQNWAQIRSTSGRSAILPAQVSFYSVPLACPAVRGLGCGSAAKPVLRAIEKDSTVQEAWLNHAGTTLAIVWKPETNSSARSAEIQTIADDRGLVFHELRGEQRDESLKSFTSEQDWYRGSEVDRLSEEEAGVIVDRLIRRAALKAPTIQEKSAGLKAAVTKVIREQLINCTSSQCREECHKKLVEVARQNLNEQEFNALMEAQKQGYLPLEGEQ